MRDLLKASAIINFIMSSLTILVVAILFPLGFFVSGKLSYVLVAVIGILIFLAVTGLIYLKYSELKLEDLYKKRGIILILGIITLFVNFVSGIILIIAFDQIGDKYYEKKLVSEKNFKVPKNLSLNIGVCLITLAGIFFALTNWADITGQFKVTIILLLSIIFMSLSKYSDKNLKLRNSKVTFWTLSIIFLIISIFTCGYYELFGNWFSFFGEGQMLFLASASVVITLLAYITYKKYKENIYLYIITFGLIASLSLILSFAGLSFIVVCLIIALIITLFNILFRDTQIINTIYWFTIGLSYVFILFNIFNLGNSPIIATIIGIILLGNLLFNDYRNNKLSILTIWTIILLIFIVSLNFERVGFFVAALGITIFYVTLLINKLINKKDVLIASLINIIMFIIVLISLAIDPFMGLMVSLLMLITYFTDKAFKNKTIENSIIPLKVLIFSVALIEFIDSIVPLSTLFGICICYFVMLFSYYLSKNKNIKLTYFILFGILLLISIFSVEESSGVITPLVILFSSLFPVLITSKNNKFYKIFSLVSFIVLLGAIFHIITTIGLFGNFGIYAIIGLYLLILLATVKHDKYRIITHIFTIFALVNLIYSPLTIPPFDIILSSCVAFYIVYLIVEIFSKNDKVTGMVYLITICLLLTSLALEKELVIGLFICFVCLIFMIFGVINSKYKKLIDLGIIFLIFNILLQLSSLWLNIPIWLYLLVIGIIIIGIIMKKELKK